MFYIYKLVIRLLWTSLLLFEMGVMLSDPIVLQSSSEEKTQVWNYLETAKHVTRWKVF